VRWIEQILRRRRIYDDLAEEIRAHIDERTDELVAQGVPLEEARHAARRAFGNVTRIEEQGRETWQWPTIESIFMDDATRSGRSAAPRAVRHHRRDPRHRHCVDDDRIQLDPQRPSPPVAGRW
jgi:hypothetical protein